MASLARRGWMSRTRRGASPALAFVVMLGLGTVATRSVLAQTLTVLYDFTGSADGGYPYAGLVRDAAGRLYGTTHSGSPIGAGAVFKVNTSGKEKVLYAFCSVSNCADGAYTYAGLLRDKAGNLYGTTYYGGGDACDGIGCGTVFKLDPSGPETVLHSFAGGSSDGSTPRGGLIRDKKGNLYGTTFGGGGAGCGGIGCGTVFKVDTTGNETVLHSFDGGTADGAWPNFTTLLRDKKGNLYGVTMQGGAFGVGVVYVLRPSGTFRVLHSFAGGTADGCNVFGTPAMDAQGNLYGTAQGCGSSGGGIVWKVSKRGSETVLHNFAGGASDGASPSAGVILDAKGNLYGDTEQGGASNLGTMFKLNKEGKLTLLHGFAGSDGEYPIGGVIRDAKGNLYGTAYEGGSDGYGTVFKLAPR